MGDMITPLKEQRQQLILEIARDRRQVTVAGLTSRFGVSEVTIRRDLRELAGRGQLYRAHGGAVTAPPASPEPPVIQRMLHRRDCKESIGRAAAALVNDGDSILSALDPLRSMSCGI